MFNAENALQIYSKFSICSGKIAGNMQFLWHLAWIAMPSYVKFPKCCQWGEFTFLGTQQEFSR